MTLGSGCHVWMQIEVIWKGYKGDLCFPTAQAVSTHWPQLEARWEGGCRRQWGRVSERPGLTFLIIEHWGCGVLGRTNCPLSGQSLKATEKWISFCVSGCALLTGSRSECVTDRCIDSSETLCPLQVHRRVSGSQSEAAVQHPAAPQDHQHAAVVSQPQLLTWAAWSACFRLQQCHRLRAWSPLHHRWDHKNTH